MIENFKESPGEFKDYYSELLLQILIRANLRLKKVMINNYLQMNFVKLVQNMSNIIPSDNSNLKRILSAFYPIKRY